MCTTTSRPYAAFVLLARRRSAIAALLMPPLLSPRHWRAVVVAVNELVEIGPPYATAKAIAKVGCVVTVVWSLWRRSPVTALRLLSLLLPVIGVGCTVLGPVKVVGLVVVPLIGCLLKVRRRASTGLVSGLLIVCRCTLAGLSGLLVVRRCASTALVSCRLKKCRHASASLVSCLLEMCWHALITGLLVVRLASSLLQIVWRRAPAS